MNGLFLGMLGGLIAGVSSLLGSLLVIIQSSLFLEREKNENPIKSKTDFLIGSVLMITSISLIEPDLGKFYRDFTRADINLWSLIAFYILGLVFIFYSRVIVSHILNSSIALVNQREKWAYHQILFFIFKSIPIGLAAGSSMLISHSGLSQTLLIAILVQSFVAGIVFRKAFASLGLDSITTLAIVSFIAMITFVMAVVGGYMSQESVKLMPVVLAFSSGAMMSVTLVEVLFSSMRLDKGKIKLSPGMGSIAIAALAFIFYKEIL